MQNIGPFPCIVPELFIIHASMDFIAAAAIVFTICYFSVVVFVVN